jgi:hypothetical protein
MKSWFFEKTNNIDKCLAKLNKRKKTQINSIRDEKEDIKTNASEIQRTIRNKFLDAYDLPKLNKVDINHLRRSLMKSKE